MRKSERKRKELFVKHIHKTDKEQVTTVTNWISKRK